MALSKLNSLYKAVVTDHSAHPHHQGRLDGVEQVNLNNPTCGDVISLSVQFDEQGMIEDIAFVNSGCSISTASASMMTDVVLGKTKEEALALAEIFSQMVQGKDDVQKKELCLLYTSDAADDLHCVDIGGSSIIKKKKIQNSCGRCIYYVVKVAKSVRLRRSVTRIM